MEYLHRLFTLLVTFLVLFNAWRSWRLRRNDRTIARLALASVLLLVLQAGFGALIVVGRLPAVFTVIDVSNSMVLLAVLVAMTAVSVQERQDARLFARTAGVQGAIAEVIADWRTRARSLRWPAAVTTAVVFAQIVVGGYFRHSGDSEALFGGNAYLRSHFENFTPGYAVSAVWLMLHMMLGVLVAASVVWLVVQCVRVRRHARASVTLLLVACLQVILGFVSLATRLSLWSDTAHFACGAVMVGLGGYVFARVLADAAPERALRRKALRRDPNFV